MDIQKIKLEKEFNTLKHSFCEEIKTTVNTISIENALLSPYSKGWENYSPFFSTNGTNWERSDNKSTIIDNTVSFNVVKGSKYISWYPSYSLNNLNNFISLNNMGSNTLYQNNIPYFKFGNNNSKTIVCLARQHPGETMGSFMIEGIVKSILDNPKLLEQYSFLIIPIANVSGVEINNHRFTSDGVDMNRAWDTNHEEIINLKEILSNVDNPHILLDIHGDEVTKFNYTYYGNLNHHDISFYSSILSDFKLLKETGRIKRFLKNLIRHKKIVSLRKPKTAKNYFSALGYDSFTLELSAHSSSPTDCYQYGVNLITNLIKKLP